MEESRGHATLHAMQVSSIVESNIKLMRRKAVLETTSLTPQLKTASYRLPFHPTGSKLFGDGITKILEADESLVIHGLDVKISVFVQLWGTPQDLLLHGSTPGGKRTELLIKRFPLWWRQPRQEHQKGTRGLQGGHPPTCRFQEGQRTQGGQGKLTDFLVPLARQHKDLRVRQVQQDIPPPPGGRPTGRRRPVPPPGGGVGSRE